MLGIRTLFGGLPMDPLQRITGQDLPEPRKKRRRELPEGEEKFLAKRITAPHIMRREEVLEEKLTSINSLLGCRPFRDLQSEIISRVISRQEFTQATVPSGILVSGFSRGSFKSDQQELQLSSPRVAYDEQFVVSSILVMLIGEETALFQLDPETSSYTLRIPQIQILHLSSPCLISGLCRVCTFASAIRHVRRRLEEIADAPGSQVVEGFLAAVDREFKQIEQELVRLHEIFMYQHGFIHCSQLVLDSSRLWCPITLECKLYILL